MPTVNLIVGIIGVILFLVMFSRIAAIQRTVDDIRRSMLHPPPAAEPSDTAAVSEAEVPPFPIPSTMLRVGSLLVDESGEELTVIDFKGRDIVVKGADHKTRRIAPVDSTGPACYPLRTK